MGRPEARVVVVGERAHVDPHPAVTQRTCLVPIILFCYIVNTPYITQPHFCYIANTPYITQPHFWFVFVPVGGRLFQLDNISFTLRYVNGRTHLGTEATPYP